MPDPLHAVNMGARMDAARSTVLRCYVLWLLTPSIERKFGAHRTGIADSLSQRVGRSCIAADWGSVCGCGSRWTGCRLDTKPSGAVVLIQCTLLFQSLSKLQLQLQLRDRFLSNS